MEDINKASSDLVATVKGIQKKLDQFLKKIHENENILNGGNDGDEEAAKKAEEEKQAKQKKKKAEDEKKEEKMDVEEEEAKQDPPRSAAAASSASSSSSSSSLFESKGEEEEENKVVRYSPYQLLTPEQVSERVRKRKGRREERWRDTYPCSPAPSELACRYTGVCLFSFHLSLLQCCQAVNRYDHFTSRSAIHAVMYPCYLFLSPFSLFCFL